MYIGLYDHMHTLRKQATIHKVTSILATSKYVLLPGHNHLLTVLLSDSCACHSALSSGNVHNVLLRADVHSYVFGDQNKLFSVRHLAQRFSVQTALVNCKLTTSDHQSVGSSVPVVSRWL